MAGSKRGEPGGRRSRKKPKAGSKEKPGLQQRPGRVFTARRENAGDAGESPDTKAAKKFDRDRFLSERVRAMPNNDFESDPARPGEYIATINGQEVHISPIPEMMGVELSDPTFVILSPDGKRGVIVFVSDPQMKPPSTWDDDQLQWLDQAESDTVDIGRGRSSLKSGQRIVDAGRAVIDDTKESKASNYFQGSFFVYARENPNQNRLLAVTTYWGFQPESDEGTGEINDVAPMVITRAAKQEEQRMTHDAVLEWQRDIAKSYASIVGIVDQYTATIRELQANAQAHEDAWAEGDDARRQEFQKVFAEYQQQSQELLRALASVMGIIGDAVTSHKHPSGDVLEGTLHRARRVLGGFVDATRSIQRFLPDRLSLNTSTPGIEAYADLDNLGHGLRALGEAQSDTRDSVFVEQAGSGTEPRRMNLDVFMSFLNNTVQERIVSETEMAIEAKGGQEYIDLLQEISDVLGKKSVLEPTFLVQAATGAGARLRKAKNNERFQLNTDALVKGLRIADGVVHFETAISGDTQIAQHMLKDHFIELLREGHFEALTDAGAIDEHTFRDELRGLAGSENIQDFMRFWLGTANFGSGEHNWASVHKNRTMREDFQRQSVDIVGAYLQHFGLPRDGVELRVTREVTEDNQARVFDVVVGNDVIGKVEISGDPTRDAAQMKAIVREARKRLAEDEQARDNAARDRFVAFVTASEPHELIPWFRGAELAGSAALFDETQLESPSYRDIMNQENGWTQIHAESVAASLEKRITSYVTELVGDDIPGAFSVTIDQDQPMGDDTVMKVTISTGELEETLSITGIAAEDKAHTNVDVLVQLMEEQQKENFIRRLFNTHQTKMSDLIRWFRADGEGRLAGSGFPYTRESLGKLADDSLLKEAISAVNARVKHYVINDVSDSRKEKGFVALTAEYADVKVAEYHPNERNQLLIEITMRDTGKTELVRITGDTDEDNKILSKFRKEMPSLPEQEAKWMEEYKARFLEAVPKMSSDNVQDLIYFMNTGDGSRIEPHVRPIRGEDGHPTPRIDKSDFVPVESWEAFVKELEPHLITHAYSSLGISRGDANFSIAISELQDANKTDEYALSIMVNLVSVHESYPFTGKETPAKKLELQQAVDTIVQDHRKLSALSEAFKPTFDKSALRPGMILSYNGPDREATADTPFLRNGMSIVLSSLDNGQVVFYYEDARDSHGTPEKPIPSKGFKKTFTVEGGRAQSGKARISVHHFVELFRAAPDAEDGKIAYAPQWMVENFTSGEFTGEDVTNALNIPEPPKQFFWAGGPVGDILPGYRLSIAKHSHEDEPPAVTFILAQKVNKTAPESPLEAGTLLTVPYADLVNAHVEVLEPVDDGGLDAFVQIIEKLTSQQLPRIDGKLDMNAIKNSLNFQVDPTDVVKNFVGLKQRETRQAGKKRGTASDVPPMKALFKDGEDTPYTDQRMSISHMDDTSVEVTYVGTIGGQLSFSKETMSLDEFIQRLAQGKYIPDSLTRPFVPREPKPMELSTEQKALEGLEEGEWPSATWGIDRPGFWGVPDEDLTYRDHQYGGHDKSIFFDFAQKALEEYGMDDAFYAEVNKYLSARRDARDFGTEGAKHLLAQLEREMNFDPEAVVDAEGNPAYVGRELEAMLKKKERATRLWYMSQDPESAGRKLLKMLRDQDRGIDFVREVRRIGKARMQTIDGPYINAGPLRTRSMQTRKQGREELRKFRAAMENEKDPVQKQRFMDIWELSQESTSWLADWDLIRRGKLWKLPDMSTNDDNSSRMREWLSGAEGRVPVLGDTVLLLGSLFAHPLSRNKLRAALLNNVPATLASAVIPGVGKEWRVNQVYSAHPAYVAQARARGLDPQRLLENHSTLTSRLLDLNPFREQGLVLKRKEKVYDPSTGQTKTVVREYRISVQPNGRKDPSVVVILNDHPHMKKGLKHLQRSNRLWAEEQIRQGVKRKDIQEEKDQSMRIIPIDAFFAMMDKGRMGDENDVDEQGVICFANGEPVRSPAPFRKPVFVLNAEGKEVLRKPPENTGGGRGPRPTSSVGPDPSMPGPSQTPPLGGLDPDTGAVPGVEPADILEPAAAPVDTAPASIDAGSASTEREAPSPETFESRLRASISKEIVYSDLYDGALAAHPTAEYFAKAVMQLVSGIGDYSAVDPELAVSVVSSDPSGRKAMAFFDAKSTPRAGDPDNTYNVQPDQITGGVFDLNPSELRLGEAMYFAGYTHQAENSPVAHFNTDAIKTKTLDNPAGFARVVTEKSHAIAAYMRDQIANSNIIEINSGEFSLDRARNELMAAASLLNMLYPERTFVVIRDDTGELNDPVKEYKKTHPDDVVIVIRDKENEGTAFRAQPNTDDFFRLTSINNVEVMQQIIDNARHARFDTGTSYENRIRHLLQGVDRNVTTPEA